MHPWRTGMQWRIDRISPRWHDMTIVWTRQRGLHKREEVAYVRLKIENFGSTSPTRGGFQPARNNDTKTDNNNGMKADNHNSTKANNHNGTKALNFYTHRSEESNQSWSWQTALLHPMLARGFVTPDTCPPSASAWPPTERTSVRSSPLFLLARRAMFQSHI